MYNYMIFLLRTLLQITGYSADR